MENPLQRGSIILVFAAVASLAAAAEPVRAQEGGANGALRVYIDCRGRACDMRQFRTEIDWVNWMRQRQDAQVHIIVSTNRTGSGGENYVVDFYGLEDLEGTDDQLTFSTLGTDVREEMVLGLQRVLGVGIARYSLLAGVAPPIELVRAEAEEDLTDRLVTSDQVDDPWDFWVFNVDFGGRWEGESRERGRSFNGGFDASRVTTTWKLDFEAGGRWSRDELELDSVTTIVDDRRNWDVEASAVYSLADHWSIGAGSEISASTRSNQDLNAAAGPQIEWSYWPYEEAPRRSLRARYQVGIRYFDYEERTIYNRTWETRPVHEFELSLNRRETWGNTFTNISMSQYLHDTNFYRVSMGGFLSFRLVRGLNLNVNGRASWIRDQLFIAIRNATPEEILLRRRRLQSDFDWDFGVGMSFQFGSIFNNVVNNRF